MDEQALKLSSDHSIQVSVFHSGISTKSQISNLKEIYSGVLPNFIFLSPERLATDGLLEYTLRKIKDKINLIVIDEIHCISQWGSDFRPFYKEIPHSINSIFNDGRKPPILGLTATLNPKDKEEICLDFGIALNNIITSKFLLRLGISTTVVKVKDEDEKDDLFWKLINDHKDEKILVYLDRKSGKRSTEELSAKAISLGYSATYFHSDLQSDLKAGIISDFKSGKVKLVFATNAFGMGIDVHDIRGIVHYLIPESTEQYYQQIGRAGRDGHSAWATLFYSEKNISVRKTHFIDKSFPVLDDINQAFKTLSGNQTNLKTFIYFEEDNTKSAYHYLLRSEAISFLNKGVQNIKVYEKVKHIPESVSKVKNNL
jgi:ATP-dependent DNA helicase RecQ